MGDATGFRFEAQSATGMRIGRMGDDVKLSPGMVLTAELPIPAHVRLLKYGEVVASASDVRTFRHMIDQPGAYRLEAFLELDGERRPWIFSNPIDVK
jgi:hypothetical protein